MGQKILVVEDNELNLKLFCDLLRAHGYEAEPVRDGREAVERARAFAPELVVMDIQMPHVSGLELIEQMKADDGLKATPIMAVTAYAAKGDEERIRDAGAEGYVSKPISVIRFVEAVAGLLDAAAARNAAPEAEVAVGDATAPADAVEAEVEAIEPEVEAEAVESRADAETAAAERDAEAETAGEADADGVDAEAAEGEVAAESVETSPPDEPDSAPDPGESGNSDETAEEGESEEDPESGAP